MSVRTVKGIIWIAIAVAFLMVLATASPRFDREESLALFMAACALLVAAVLWYRWVMPDAEARDEEERIHQTAELRQVVLGGRPVEVKAGSGAFLLVLMAAIALGSGYATFTDPSVESTVTFAISIVLAPFTALLTLPVIGKPALIIQGEGVTTAVLGEFKWQAIESIGLRSYSSGGFTSHSLHLYVPDMEARESSQRFLHRLRRHMTRGTDRRIVVVPLHSPSIPATVIHALCHALWNECTGRTSIATIAPSRAVVELKRRADEHFDELKRLGDLAQTNPAEAMKLLDELKQRFPPGVSQQRRSLHPRRKASVEAMMAEMRTIDPRDELGRKRVMDKHVKAEVRRGMTVAVVLIIVGFALVMTAVILLNG